MSALVARAPVPADAPLRVLALASGTGSTFHALINGAAQAGAGYMLCGLVVNRPGAGALHHAAAANVPSWTVPHTGYPTRTAFEHAVLQSVNVDYDIVALCGFMRVLTGTFLDGCGAPVLNVHPSLLPRFPGMDAPAQAIAAGVTESGCTVHRVDTGVDTGPILTQRSVVVRPDDDATTLHRRIQAAERELYVTVLNDIARGAL